MFKVSHSFLFIAVLLAFYPVKCSAYSFYKAFAFGSTSATRSVYNSPDTDYIKVNYNGDYEYTSAQKYGYTRTNGITITAGSGLYSGDNAIYDQNIHIYSHTHIVTELYMVFRIDVPNGKYKFVGGFGDPYDTFNDNKATISVKDGDSGQEKELTNQATFQTGIFYSIGFDDKIPPPGTGSGNTPSFLPMIESPELEVTQGFIEVHQKCEKVLESQCFIRGSPLCVFEVWSELFLESISVTALDASASEINSDTGQFKITRSSSSGDLTVYYQITGTADNGTDYQTLDGSVVIPDGQLFATVTVTPVDDSYYEDANEDETVILTVYDAPGYMVTSPGNATVSIADDDTAAILNSTVELTIIGGANGYIKPADGEFANIFVYTSKSERITAKIYTLSGRLVWEYKSPDSATNHGVIWSCLDTSGQEVSAGVYVLHVKGGSINKKAKIVIVK